MMMMVSVVSCCVLTTHNKLLANKACSAARQQSLDGFSSLLFTGELYKITTRDYMANKKVGIHRHKTHTFIALLVSHFTRHAHLLAVFLLLLIITHIEQINSQDKKAVFNWGFLRLLIPDPVQGQSFFYISGAPPGADIGVLTSNHGALLPKIMDRMNWEKRFSQTVHVECPLTLIYPTFYDFMSILTERDGTKDQKDVMSTKNQHHHLLPNLHIFFESSEFFKKIAHQHLKINFHKARLLRLINAPFLVIFTLFKTSPVTLQPWFLESLALLPSLFFDDASTFKLTLPLGTTSVMIRLQQSMSTSAVIRQSMIGHDLHAPQLCFTSRPFLTCINFLLIFKPLHSLQFLSFFSIHWVGCMTLPCLPHPSCCVVYIELGALLTYHKESIPITTLLTLKHPLYMIPQPQAKKHQKSPTHDPMTLYQISIFVVHILSALISEFFEIFILSIPSLENYADLHRVLNRHSLISPSVGASPHTPLYVNKSPQYAPLFRPSVSFSLYFSMQKDQKPKPPSFAFLTFFHNPLAAQLLAAGHHYGIQLSSATFPPSSSCSVPPDHISFLHRSLILLALPDILPPKKSIFPFCVQQKYLPWLFFMLLHDPRALLHPAIKIKMIIIMYQWCEKEDRYHDKMMKMMTTKKKKKIHIHMLIERGRVGRIIRVNIYVCQDRERGKGPRLTNTNKLHIYSVDFKIRNRKGREKKKDRKRYVRVRVNEIIGNRRKPHIRMEERIAEGNLSMGGTPCMFFFSKKKVDKCVGKSVMRGAVNFN
ncbi:putative signal peptide protein [Puccinia sorghi]|uniref:Putative signal peptide protein n=1 Tax=Puccinia sorghi TaxID=27349 RepID=A0A0L6VQH8_9BASI|nr:putative signal peptide protein [Puccinia sorghi]